jgi:ClpP class serine protease
MNHKTIRLTESLYNTPHLISPVAFDGIMSYLDSRNSSIEASTSSAPVAKSANTSYDPATKTGTLKVSGALTYRTTALTALCGMTSYQQLQSDFDQLVDQGAKTIALWIDSGGGQAYGVFETASYLRKTADEHNVRLVTYCDGLMASAAYALGCVAHEVILNPASECGSIGVVVKLRNTNQQLKNSGVEDTYLIGGAEKVPFSNDGSWRTEFIADIQSKVNFLYGQFTSFVSKHRKISLASVVDTQARMYTAEDAVQLGLADSTMTREEFDQYLSTRKTMTAKHSTYKAVSPAAQATKPSTACKPAPTPTVAADTSKPLDRRSRIPEGFSDVAKVLILNSTKHQSEEQFNESLAKLEREWIGRKTA